MAFDEQILTDGDPHFSLPTPTLPEKSQKSQIDFEIEFFSGILERNPNYVDVLRVLGNNYTSKGDYRSGLEIDRRLARLRPHDRVAHYNLACSYSLLGMVESALIALQKAIEFGYDEFDYMQEDRDLQNIRKDPRFRELLENYGIL